MPYRKIPFVNKEIYHLVARGVARKPIFTSNWDYQRMLKLIDFYRYGKPGLRFSYFHRLPKKEKEAFSENLKKKKPVVAILAFCLMPNHFHFLLKQLESKGISVFMSNLQNSYARYFNTKHKRVGPLFQPMFRAKRIETEEQLLHVSRYIHLNPVSSYLIEIKELKDYRWSSFAEYLSIRPPGFTRPDLILGIIGSKKAYQQFVFDQADYQRKLERIKHLTLER